MVSLIAVTVKRASVFLCAIEKITQFFFHSANVACFTDQFSRVELSLYFRSNSHLVTVYNSFTVLLHLISQSFVKFSIDADWRNGLAIKGQAHNQNAKFGINVFTEDKVCNFLLLKWFSVCGLQPFWSCLGPQCLETQIFTL